MKPLLQVLLIFTVLAFGCRKEPETGRPELLLPGETPDGQQLGRIVFQLAATDSLSTELFYDAAGRWVGSKANNNDPVLNDYVQTKAYRDGNGFIYRYMTLTDANEDSSVYRVLYEPSRQRYEAKVRVDGQTGKSLDSTAYEYNANNRIIRARLFMKPAEGAAYQERAKAEFLYNDRGDLVRLRNYTANMQAGGVFEVKKESAFTFDNRVNPLNLGMEAIVADQVLFISSNNITAITTKALDNSGRAAEEVVFNYLYHASQKPRSGHWANGGTVKVPMYFRYR